MVLFNYSTKELTAKVVYYGPGLCGKTTNLQWIHEKLPIKNKGKMLSLATETDRTLFFDFLPIELGTIRGMKTRIQLYTVPGQVFYNATRRMVLKGADCVVFVADSQEPMLDANLESLENLRENLEANEIDPDEIPMVLQYNKRDLPNALPVEILNERLNPRGLPFFEAVAMKGQGVEETLKGATALVFRSLAAQVRRGSGRRRARSGRGRARRRCRRRAPAAPPPPRAAPAAPAAPAAAGAPVRPAPRRRLRPRGRPPGARRLPPMAAADDELLESIDLQPARELIEEAPEIVPRVGIGDRVRVRGRAGARDAAPRRAPPSGAATLVRTASEVDEMRARIGRTTDPELTLDASTDEEDIEEISFDTAPEPRAGRRAGAGARPGAASAPPPRARRRGARVRAAARRRGAPHAAPDRALAGPPGVRAASATIPPVASRRQAGEPAENTAPIRVSATVTANDSRWPSPSR